MTTIGEQIDPRASNRFPTRIVDNLKGVIIMKLTSTAIDSLRAPQLDVDISSLDPALKDNPVGLLVRLFIFVGAPEGGSTLSTRGFYPAD